MTNQERVFIYTRKSTDTEDRQVYSLDHQLKELRALAAREGLEVVEEFQESRTAKYPGRPEFNKMLQGIKSGRASCILAWSADRLSRNSVDGGMLIHCLDTKVITNLRFASGSFESTPHGMLVLAIDFGMAKFYVDAMGQRISMANKNRIAAGYWPKQAPLGYLFDHRSRTLVIDPDRAPLIRKMFEAYSTGNYTIHQLTRLMNEQGLKTRETKNRPAMPLGKSHYYRLLMKPVYSGVIRYKGELFEGKHPQIVPPRLFDKCQVILAQRGYRSVSKNKKYLYQGFFMCGECGCRITNETQKGHNYLRCTKRKGPCHQPYLREEEASWQVAQILERLSIDRATADWMIRRVKSEEKQSLELAAKDAEKARAEIAKFSDKEQRLTMAYVDGDLEAQSFREAKAQLIKNKQVWVERLGYAQIRGQARLEPIFRFIKALHRAKTIATGKDVALQRDFLKNTGSNFILKNGSIRVVFTGCWEVAWLSPCAAVGKFPAPTPAPAKRLAHEKFPVLWASEREARTLLDRIQAFFKDNPTWE